MNAELVFRLGYVALPGGIMEYGIAAGSSQTDMPYFEASGTGRGKHTQYRHSGLCVLKLEPTCRRFMKLYKTQLPFGNLHLPSSVPAGSHALLNLVSFYSVSMTDAKGLRRSPLGHNDVEECAVIT